MSTILAGYSLGDVIISMFVFFLWIIWIYLLIIVFSDIFRSKDLNGVAKAIWTIFVVILPYLGVLVYLIARGDKMQEHAVAARQAQQDAFKAYVQEAAGTGGGGTADEIAKLKQLHESGVLSDAEFESAKAKALGG